MNGGDDPSFSTAPPPGEEPTGLARLKTRAVESASTALMPVARRVAPDHIGGETVEDALAVARRLAGEGVPNTLGFWDTGADSVRQVADIYLDTVGRLSASGLDGYVSMKPPALRFDDELASQLAETAAAAGIRLHADSHGPEVADRSAAMLETMLLHLSPDDLGTTLPGRWSRSLADADWAVDRRLAVRVVKGQWPDPADPERDMSTGFLEVIDRLAGRARHVAVASHDLELADSAITRLRAAGTSCELELIHGVPMADSLEWARRNDVAVRVYVPFGKGFIPNAARLLRHNPRLAWQIARGVVTDRRRSS